MTAEEAHHERLVEIAVSAHRHSVAINLARAVSSLYSAHRPTRAQSAEIADGDATAMAADKALAEWRERRG